MLIFRIVVKILLSLAVLFIKEIYIYIYIYSFLSGVYTSVDCRYITGRLQQR